MPRGYLRAGSITLLALFGCLSARAGEGSIDRIVAVVEDGVILESELAQKVAGIKRGLAQSNTALPPDSILTRQVLERMIVDKIQLQMAEKAGIKADDETVRMAVQQIAQRNRITVEDLRRSLQQEGMSYGEFLNQIRNEIITGRFRSSQINSQIKVSDREIDSYLQAQQGAGISPDREYLLGHILIATPQAAAPADVQKAREKSERLVEELKRGADFKQAALENSDDAQALSGGDLGWRKLGQVPSLFAELVPRMKEGDIEGPLRSPNGYHIIKLLGTKGAEEARMTKTHVRHILIKPNETLSDSDAQQKLAALRERIASGEEFAELARAHSDDKASAIKGGDLGYVEPGALVPPFEEAMNRLSPNDLSEPVQTQFGWHLIQVLGREESTNTDEALRNRAREEIFKRKVEEETELWLRRIRDESYVEIRLEEPQVETFMPSFN